MTPTAAKRAVGAGAGILLAALLLVLPGIGMLVPLAQRALAVLALGVVFWATEVLNAGVTALLVLGLLLVAGVPASVALAGFATPAWWVLLCVLFLGTAMERTGLARRVACVILARFRPTYAGILAGLFAIGFVLMLGVPSMTVRTAIVVPVAWAVVQTLPIPRPGPGSAVIVLTAFEMAVLPGVALLTGSLWGPYLAGLFASSGLPLSWAGYARVMAVPTVVWCVLVVAANLWLFAPCADALPNQALLREERARLGPMRSQELATAAVVALAVACWMLQPWHRVPSEAVGMLALTALIGAGVLAPADLGGGAPWPLLLFVGGMLGVTQAITAYGINTWLAGFIMPSVEPFTFNAFAFVAALGVAVTAMRTVEPGGFVTIAAFFLALAGAATPLRGAPLALAGAILLPVHVFLFNYQNVWIVMTEGITGGAAFTAADRTRYAIVFLAATLAALMFAVVWWRWLGAI